MAPIQPSHPHFHGQRGAHIDGHAARRGATWTQDPSIGPWSGYLPRQNAVQQLFRRWPFVPSRELERIRLVLLHCDEIAHPAVIRRLSEPAQALLDLVTGELARRRESGNHRPGSGNPATETLGLPKHPGRRRGGLL